MKNNELQIISIILWLLTTAGIMVSYYLRLPYIAIGAIAVAGYGIGIALFIMGQKKEK